MLKREELAVEMERLQCLDPEDVPDVEIQQEESIHTIAAARKSGMRAQGRSIRCNTPKQLRLKRRRVGLRLRWLKDTYIDLRRDVFADLATKTKVVHPQPSRLCPLQSLQKL